MYIYKTGKKGLQENFKKFMGKEKISDYESDRW